MKYRNYERPAKRDIYQRSKTDRDANKPAPDWWIDGEEETSWRLVLVYETSRNPANHSVLESETIRKCTSIVTQKPSSRCLVAPISLSHILLGTFQESLTAGALQAVFIVSNIMYLNTPVVILQQSCSRNNHADKDTCTHV